VNDVPIQQIGQILIASIQTDLSDESTLALQGALSNKIIQTGARGVIIDISALEIVDSFIGRMLATIASTSRLLDADTVVVGMRPAVAITLTELGLSLGSVRTALNAEMAFKLLGESSWKDAHAGDLLLTSTASDDDSTARDY
jgi:rsbT antagonist protein RsbS